MDDKTQTDELEWLGTVKFGTLSAAERELMKQVPSAEWAKCGPTYEDKDNDPKDAEKWGKERRIRAELIAWLCTNEHARKHVHARGIRVYGADITGPLNVSFVKILFHCSFCTAGCKGTST